MIELKVNDAKCELKASGRAAEVAIEIMTATHALIEAFADATHMSFEAAALVIMQSNNAVYRKSKEDRDANMD